MPSGSPAEQMGRGRPHLDEVPIVLSSSSRFPAMVRAVRLPLLATLILGVAGLPMQAAPTGTAFTYQGQLKDAGVPATGAYDFEFKLFDAASGPGQIGGTVFKDDVGVAAGLFAVSLDFGTSAFNGNARFLEIGVRIGTSTGSFTTLPGRQELTPTPNAIHASNSAQLNGQSASYYTNLANMTGVLQIANGGTGASTADGARTSLGAAPEAYSYAGPVTLDTVGTNSSTAVGIAIGTDGFPIISYWDSVGGALKVAHCLDRACATSETFTIDG